MDSTWDTKTTLTIEDPVDLKYTPSDEPYRLGVEHFNRGHYGLSEQYFRDAVEKSPRNAHAWLGLAASYDRIYRFPLADRAYKQAIKISGRTTQILNNMGYSYLLRGDLERARAKFVEASRHEPDNPTIRNNLRLLDASYKLAQK